MPTMTETALVLLPIHERLLVAVQRYGMLTAGQATRLLYDSRSLTRVQARLKELADAGCLLRLSPGRSGPRGSLPLVYSLDRGGRQYLQGIGVSVPKRLRQSEEETRSTTLLLHTLRVIDLQIALEQLVRRVPQVRIARMLGERALKATPVPVTLRDGTETTVINDCWADLRLTTPEGIFQECLAFEMDNGTEYGRAWREKIASLLMYERGPYQESFGVPFLTVAVVTPDTTRRDTLRKWTAAEITASGAVEQADIFRFAALPPDWEQVTNFFLGDAWYRIGDETPVPLIEGIALPLA